MVSIGENLQLKRGDLLTFPKETVDLILKMQKEGWRGQLNRQGHVKMLAPDMETYVMATSNPNSPTYLRSGYNQYVKKHGGEEVNAVLPKGAQKWPCARPGCPKVYATEQQLNDHIAVDHEGLLLCPEKDCHETFKLPNTLGRHRQVKHGYESPNKARRKKQEAARIKKAAESEVEGAREAGKAIGEAIKSIVGADKIHDKPAEFQPSETVILAPSEKPKITEGRLPEAPVKVIHHPMDTKPEEGASFFQHNVASPGPLSVTEVYEQTRRQLADLRVSVKSAAVVRTENDLEFIDSRDSWVVSHELLGRRRIRDLEEMFGAAGLLMEIRVWKAE